MAKDKYDARNGKFDTGSGKDVKDTSQLKGEATKAPSWNSKNVTEQYTADNPPKGNTGGENTNS